jgi:hypothetical protein
MLSYGHMDDEKPNANKQWDEHLKRVAEAEFFNFCKVCRNDLGESIVDARSHQVICPVCGIQYGYEDVAGGSIEKRERIYIFWRKIWNENGQKSLNDEQRKLVISYGMGFNTESRSLDVFKNLEGKLPEGTYKSSLPANYISRKDTVIPDENPTQEDKPLDEFFEYRNDLENRIDGFIFIIPNGIMSKAELLNKYAEIMPEYFGKNWDALDEMLHDLSWINQRLLIIIHTDLPQLEDRELRTYLKILAESVQLMNAGPRRDFILPYGTHKLKIIFPVNTGLRIKELLTNQ